MTTTSNDPGSNANKYSRAIYSSGLPTASGDAPLFVNASGGLVTDTRGQTYIDFILGYGSVCLGHRQPNRCTLDGSLILPPGYTVGHQQLAESLLMEFPEDFGIAFFKTASESVSAALRLAAHDTGQLGFIRCGFLGWHDAELANTPRWHEPPTSPLRANLRYTTGFRGVQENETPWNWISLDLGELRETLTNARGQVGALVLDTYQTRFMSADTVDMAVGLCRQNGAIIIADETKSAGRVSRIGLSDMNSWDPDLVIVGKSISNGFPLSMLLGRRSLLSKSVDTRITGTHAQEALSVKVALATIAEMEHRNGYARLKQIGAQVCRILNCAAETVNLHNTLTATPIFGGSMFEIMFGERFIGDWPARTELPKAFAQAGVLLLQGHPSYVCLDHEEIDHDELFSVSCRAFSLWKDKLGEASDDWSPRAD